jgi:hypothetical protein
VRFKPPPAHCHHRGPLTAAERAAIEAEGSRQADSFYPCRSVEQHALTIAVCQLGIERLTLRGVVRVRHGRVFFWRGDLGAFCLYTPATNEYFLRLMRPFRVGVSGAQLVMGMPKAMMN